MAEKLSWTELRRALAARAGVSEKKAGVFLNAFQEQLVEALKSDKQVKINGLGTFKVQAVASRKSVNVATGEDFIIEGYNKLAFTPEAGVRELIESQEPSSDSEPAAVSAGASEIDPLKKLGAQAEEIIDLLGELGQKPGDVQRDEDEVPSDQVQSDQVLSDEVPSTKEVEPEPDQVPSDEVPSTKEPEPEPEVIIAPEPKKKKKESHFVRDTLICVVILLLLLLVGYFFLRQQLSSIIDSLLQPAQTEVVAEETAKPVESVEPVEEPAEEVQEVQEPMEPVTESSEARTKSISQEQIMAEFMAVSGEEADSRYPNLITVEAMHEASRLAWMSKRFYGAKIYWPYLYDANRDVIKNPCLIQVGTPIRVPKLTKLQLDTTNAETAAYLEQLRIEAEAACGK
jgi:nucleoid DNA-binding protein